MLSTESIERLYKPVSDKIGIYDLVFDAYGLGHYIEKLPNGMLSISIGVKAAALWLISKQFQRQAMAL